MPYRLLRKPVHVSLAEGSDNLQDNQTVRLALSSQDTMLGFLSDVTVVGMWKSLVWLFCLAWYAG